VGVLGGGIMGEGWRGGIRMIICRGGIIRRAIGGWGRIWRLGRRRWGGGGGRLRGRLEGRLGERGVVSWLHTDFFFVSRRREGEREGEIHWVWAATTTTIWMMDIPPLALMRRAKSGSFFLAGSLGHRVHTSFFVLFGERDGRLSTMCYYLLHFYAFGGSRWWTWGGEMAAIDWGREREMEQWCVSS
jgi:hypothetical protein